MSKVEIKRIRLKNFKGVKSFEAEFTTEKGISQMITIKGANETGKTTITDAFYWCLFDKDSNGRKDFEVKTIEPKTKEVIPKLEHEVEVELLENGEFTTFKKVYVENWKNKRGADKEHLSGHTKKYYWEGVLFKKKADYDEKVAKVITEGLFKLLTNPNYFPSLKWTEQRDHLLELVPSFSDRQFAKDNNYNDLLKKVGEKMTFQQYKDYIKNTIDANREEVKYLPTRIDEKYQDLDHELEDKSYYEGQISKAQKRIDEINAEIENTGGQSKAQTDKLKKIDNEISDYNRKLIDAKNKIYQHYKDVAQKSQEQSQKNKIAIEQYQSRIDADTENLNYINDVTLVQRRKELTDQQKELNAKREEFKKISQQEYKPLKAGEACNCCGQEIKGKHLDKKNEALKAEYNKNRAEKLESINTEGKAMKRSAEIIEKDLNAKTSQIAELQKSIENNEIGLGEARGKQRELDHLVSVNEKALHELDYNVDEVKEIKTEIEDLKVKREKLADETDESQKNYIEKLKQERYDWQVEITEANNNIAKVNANEKTQARIHELRKQEKNLQTEIAKLEKDQFEISNFEINKIQDFENRINSMFNYVDFRLFDYQMNGGYKPTCEPTVSGVSYREVNTAGKINAGIDIINVFSKYYDMSAPIFVDNRESITNLLKTDSQVINLQVDKNKKQLEVNNK